MLIFAETPKISTEKKNQMIKSQNYQNFSAFAIINFSSLSKVFSTLSCISIEYDWMRLNGLKRGETVSTSLDTLISYKFYIYLISFAASTWSIWNELHFYLLNNKSIYFLNWSISSATAGKIYTLLRSKNVWYLLVRTAEQRFCNSFSWFSKFYVELS